MVGTAHLAQSHACYSDGDLIAAFAIAVAAGPAGTTATATVAATTASTTTWAIFARAGDVDCQWAAAVILAVEHSDGALSLFGGRHLNEAEAL